MKSAMQAVGTGRRRCAVVGVVAAILSGGLAGCDVDSFLDPSVVGRWENTPVTLPILDRLDVIEEPDESVPGLSQISSEDLIPAVSEYVLGPGDSITVTIFELITPNAESVQTRQVDELGFIRLPVVGQVNVSGLTTKQLEQRIIDILHPNILRDPTVTVIVQAGRQKTFNIIGAGGTGTYSLVKADFRLLDAIAMAQSIPLDVEKIYVIRQVPLSSLVEGRIYGEESTPGAHEPPLSPGQGEGAGPSGRRVEPVDTGQLLEELTRELEQQSGGATEEDGTQNVPQFDGAILHQDGARPGGQTEATRSLGEVLDEPGGGNVRWVNVNGRWVRVMTPQPTVEEPVDPGMEQEATLPAPEQMITQRVIEVDAEQLLKGVARYNIVVRPGDIIRIPEPQGGNVFIGGEIARPGTYVLRGEKTLTLKQLVIAAGGLGPLAIPERVDLTRRLDNDSETTIRLNLRAIFEGVQPDIYIKADDTVNIGTNLPATFLAVIRNAFRMSYGFGFLLDRNFATDVFGPTNNN